MSRAAGWIAGVAVFLGLSALALRNYVPPLPGALRLEISFHAMPRGANEPLLTTGAMGSGDFVFVRYLADNQIAFGYDEWGAGGPVSTPIDVTPGSRYALILASPSGGNVRGSAARGPERVRVVFDGRTVLDAPATFRLRPPAAAWLAENPIGGSFAPRFSGELFWPDGRAVRGGVRDAFRLWERIVGWLYCGRWQVAGILALAAGAGWLAAWFGRTRGRPLREFAARHRLGPHRWFVTAAGVCVVAFAWLITCGSGQLAYADEFGDFYDYQAASLLQGRLDVPRAAIGNEAFVLAGKSYGYFGPTPALLRLPLVAFDLGFGKLTRGFMLVDYAAGLLAAYLLLLVATRFARGPGARPGGLAVVLFTTSIGLGSTLFFLGGRPYVYHEAILCGATFALFACWCALQQLAAPASRWWIGALVCGVLAVQARPPAGLFALTLLGLVALLLAGDCLGVGGALVAPLARGEQALARPTAGCAASAQPTNRGSDSSCAVPLAVVALCVAGALSFHGLSYLKFRTLEGCPLRLHVQYTPERLARIDGRNFHLSNLRYNFYTYVLHLNLERRPGFPWLYLGRAVPGRNFREAKIDLLEWSLALPWSMTALCLLATAGCALACVRHRELRPPIAIAWVAVGPMALALFTAVATAHRYTADFCPFLVTAGAFGLAGIELLPSRWRALAFAVLAAAALWCMAVTAALTLHQAETAWGQPEEAKQRYRLLRTTVDNFFGRLSP